MERHNHNRGHLSVEQARQYANYCRLLRDRCPKAITKFAFLGEDSASFSSKTTIIAWVSIKQIIAKNRVNALNRKGKQKNESITNQ